MQSFWVAGHLGVRLPATPPPLLRPNGGGQPWPCACAQGPANTLSKLHAAWVSTSICCCTPTGMSTTASKLQRAATVGSRLSSLPAPEDLHNQDVEHLINGLQQGNLLVCSLDQGKRPLRHDSDVNDLDMHKNGHVNNTTKNCTCGISTVCTAPAGSPRSVHKQH